MDESAARTRVEWHEWGEEAFARADAEDKPVLLSLSARWCSYCHEMDRETYDEPRIAANVADAFVPVRVDADRRPRVRDRYNMGGFPSTVFLAPDGRVLTGAGYLGEDGMRQVLDSVREMWADRGTDAAQVPRSVRGDPTPAGDVDEELPGLMVAQLDGTYDERAGGWGTPEKFPMPRTVEFALKRRRDQAERTLAAISANLFDDYAGGFYRYATSADWSDPHYEKLTDANAALVRAFANAYLYTGHDEYRTPAERTVEYLTTTLWADGAFAGSQAAGEGADYYQRDATDREAAPAPPVDETAFADRNALAVDALLTYHAYTDDERAARYAENALDFLREELVEDGTVVHYRADDAGDPPRGLLSDHAHTVRALCTARQVLGTGGVAGDALDEARELADSVIDELHSDGSFLDGPLEGPGLLDRPLRPLDGTVEMADALLDCHHLTGDDRYREAAHDAVAAFAGAKDRLGVRVAGYAGVAARLLTPQLVIRVGDEAGSDLHRAALRMADHEKVVVPDAAVDDGTAVVSLGEATAPPAGTPAELSERVAEYV